MAGVFGILVFLVLVVAPIVGGVLLIVFSRRRGHAHAACGKCGYNLGGSIGTATRCPECGADFVEVGITPPGPAGKRNRTMVVAGVALIVGAFGCCASSYLLVGARSMQTVPVAPAPAAPGGAGAPPPANAPADGP